MHANHACPTTHTTQPNSISQILRFEMGRGATHMGRWAVARPTPTSVADNHQTRFGGGSEGGRVVCCHGEMGRDEGGLSKEGDSA